MNNYSTSFTSGQSRISQLTNEIRALASNIRSELTRDPSQSMLLQSGQLSSNRSVADPNAYIHRASHTQNYQSSSYNDPSSLSQEVLKKSYHLPSNPQPETTEELLARISRMNLGQEDSNRLQRSSYTPENTKSQTTKNISPKKENSIAEGLLDLHAKVDEVMGRSPVKHPSPSKMATSLNASGIISKGLLSPPTIGQKLTSSPPKSEHAYLSSSYGEVKRSLNNSQRNSISPESSKKNKTVTFSDQKGITPTQSAKELNITPSKQHLYDKDKLNQILDAIKSRKSTY